MSWPANAYRIRVKERCSIHCSLHLPFLQSNREMFVRSPAGTMSAEMFPWRQGRAEHSRKDAPYSPSMGSVVAFVADTVHSKSISLL